MENNWSGAKFEKVLRTLEIFVCPSCHQPPDHWRFIGVTTKLLSDDNEHKLIAAYCSLCGFVREHSLIRFEENSWH